MKPAKIDPCVRGRVAAAGESRVRLDELDPAVARIPFHLDLADAGVADAAQEGIANRIGLSVDHRFRNAGGSEAHGIAPQFPEHRVGNALAARIVAGQVYALRRIRALDDLLQDHARVDRGREPVVLDQRLRIVCNRDLGFEQRMPGRKALPLTKVHGLDEAGKRRLPCEVGDLSIRFQPAASAASACRESPRGCTGTACLRAGPATRSPAKGRSVA